MVYLFYFCWLIFFQNSSIFFIPESLEFNFVNNFFDRVLFGGLMWLFRENCLQTGSNLRATGKPGRNRTSPVLLATARILPGISMNSKGFLALHSLSGDVNKWRSVSFEGLESEGPHRPAGRVHGVHGAGAETGMSGAGKQSAGRCSRQGIAQITLGTHWNHTIWG